MRYAKWLRTREPKGSSVRARLLLTRRPGYLLAGERDSGYPQALAAVDSASDFNVSSCFRIITKSPRARTRPVSRGGQACGPQRDLLAANERLQHEHGHEPLPDFEVHEFGVAFAGTASAEVIEDVVAVGRRT